jgi:hypothetical protein
VGEWNVANRKRTLNRTSDGVFGEDPVPSNGPLRDGRNDVVEDEPAPHTSAHEPPVTPDLSLHDPVPSPPQPPADAITAAPPTASAPVAIPLAAVREPTPAAALTPLEQRLRRLEDALAQMQDVNGLETRVAERVTGRLMTQAPVAPVPAPSSALADFGKLILQAPAAVARSFRNSPVAVGARRAWLIQDALAEARAILRMFVDPRYRLSWTGRILPPLFLGLVLTSYYWLPGTSVPIFGYLFNKVADLALTYVLYKLLAYEARRYRETAPDLPPSLRL